MSILEEVNASAGNDVIIRTLELTCSAWDSPVLICNGFEDKVCVDELGRTLTFEALNIEIALAAKNGKGNQQLAFGVDNTTGEVSRKTDASINARARVNATYRTFLESNTTAPQEPPYHMVVFSGTLKGIIAQLQCGFFNMLGVAWPRALYTTNVTPALRYI